MNFIIHTEDRKISVSELFNNVQDGDIILDPEYQRNYVYDLKRASKVIESILLEIPLPAIFVNEEQDSTVEVIDGVQRITSIIKFLNSEYQLVGLEILSDINGKTFKDLSSSQKREFKQKSLHVIKFKKDCSDDIKFEIFLRLNQGSVKLNNQELRNCLYRGYLNNKIKEVASNEILNDVFSLSDVKTNRFAKEELILRGLTLLNEDKFITKNGLNANMNAFMNTFKNDINNSDIFIDEYLDNIRKIKLILGPNCFKHGLTDSKFMATYYDCFLLLFSKYNINSLIKNKDTIRNRIKIAVKTEEFLQTIKRSSVSKSNINKRVEIILNEINDLIINLDEKRTFSYKQKEEFFKKNNICSICNNVIDSIDDANVDHIIPWSKGGKTTLDNAQITHEFCNKSKGNKEVAYAI